MICPPCRNAGAVRSETDVIYQYLDGRDQETLTGPEAAAKMHKTCKGGTWCDCQHSTEPLVRRPRG